MTLNDLMKFNFGIYRKALAEIKKQHGAETLKYRKKENEYLSGCFTWSKSKDGHACWSEINNTSI